MPKPLTPAQQAQEAVVEVQIKAVLAIALRVAYAFVGDGGDSAIIACEEAEKMVDALKARLACSPGWK
jgi:hypothetical protein